VCDGRCAAAKVSRANCALSATPGNTGNTPQQPFVVQRCDAGCNAAKGGGEVSVAVRKTVWLTNEQAAERLGIHRVTLWRERGMGRIKAVKRRGRLWYSEQEIQNYRDNYGLPGQDERK
jgi:hypothetical protein